MSENILELNEQNFDSEIKNSEVPVLVDFWAPWCGPCKALTPIVESFAAANSEKIKVCKVNVDDNPAIATRWTIMNIPALIFFKQGEEADRVVGVVSEDELNKKLAGI